MKAVGKVFDDFFEKIIDEHIQFKDETRTRDFVDVMLDFVGSEETEYHIGRDNIKAIMLDMLVGSMDTSATTIEWTLSELMKHPRPMKKLVHCFDWELPKNMLLEELDMTEAFGLVTPRANHLCAAPTYRLNL
ncbi:hypothetical protein OIU84_029591 [Salix udensis]|uniref:Cytochrome P450 n=1 Tax=Salix udensis TaxID=889485 RepID=A0AAD6KB75_9ROSI|nr:hypothetical protein OIU84_029591 [Salix udensis]